MNVLSLFDGISVAKQALVDLHIQHTYIASEIDKYAIQISESNWEDIWRLDDVKDISKEDFDGLYNIDLLVGGSPCQGFSLQGLQKGLEDPRSALVSEYIRIKNELNPKWFLLENTRMKAECKEFISDALGVRPIEINSLTYTGQSRNRLYWTNIPIISMNKAPIQKFILEYGERPGVTRKGPPRHVVFTDHFGCLTATYYKGIRADGRPLITTKEGEFDEIRQHVRMLTPEECEQLQGLPKHYTSGVSNTQRYKALGNAFTLPVIKHIFQGLK